MRMIKGLENLSYRGKLKELNLFCIPKRKLRNDLILVYNYLSVEQTEESANL